MIPLGPYDLQHTLGRGGMGEVWRAVHTGQHLSVAVKVLTTETARSANAKAAFRREVQAVAGLDHPGIVVAFNYGEITEEAADASFGRLVPGSPTFAMELAETSLRARLGEPWEWSTLRALLLDLLAALAHAHARGVLHRDIKPGNVLLFADGTAKLADFGLAWSLEDETARRAARAGTPEYMPPEQIAGHWRDFGPWTDLFALGRTAERLAPDAPAPEAFRAWLDRMTAPHPADRFACAAHARDALAAIEAPPTSPVRSSGAGGWADSFDIFASVAPPAEPEPPPTRSRAHLGAGLGLYGLRRPPLVGRERERAVLLDALDRVRRSARPEAVTLVGSAGTGKSRLARWICEEAEERGLAAALRVRHGERRGPMHGVVPTLELALRCHGLDRRAVFARIGRARPDWTEAERAELTELIRPLQRGEDLGGVPRAPLDDAARRRVAIREIGASSPAILWLDDAQWSPESLALAREILDGEGAVLVVLAIRSEAVDDPTAELVRDLDAHERARQLEIAPMQGAERVALVSGLLGLAGEIVSQVADRTAGVPLFAVQLVDDWVQRGLLEVGESGLRLRDGAEVPIPDALHELWIRRVEDLLDGRSAEVARALELAAVLGTEVSAEEWTALCTRAAAEASEDLVGAMIDRGLAERRHGDDWAFAHGMLAESVLRRADESCRLDAHRACCAETLGALGQEALEVGAVRRADALLERAVDQAVGEGARALWRGRLGRAQMELGRVVQAEQSFREALQHPDAIGERSTGIFLGNLGVLYRRLGRNEAAREHFDRALAIHTARGDAQGEGMTLGNLGVLAMFEGRLADAQAAFTRVLALYQELGDRRYQLVAHTNLGDLSSALGQVDAARAHFDRGLALCRELSDRRSEGTIRISLGTLLYNQGDLDGALAQNRAAMALLEEVGDRRNASYAQANLAQNHLDAGRVDDAAAAIEEASRFAREVGEKRAIGSFESLGALIEARRGNLDRARALLDSGEAHLREAGDRIQLGLLFVRRGRVALLAGDREAAGACLADAVALEGAENSELARAIAALQADLQRP